MTAEQAIKPKLRSIDGLAIHYAESEPRDDHAVSGT